ncbi:hypothetical protein NC796_05060 [Aliifodinibius sp. S!AR15-10]|uniref:hypothetical protein n=1 Tax=Aliifodinibius sp. S!AR15-10 TaxID=2950437 RepID=UPI00285A5D2C|nr:hypothetical protein [Aliifodinibius sp. S!AR15-10]MDR8390501.1 hypothetical protein [Aliifodinibius sp. S!AR15-10]
MSSLKPLFKAVLQYDDSIETPFFDESEPGSYIGKGRGTMEGDKITGHFIWRLNAENCAFLWTKKGDTPPPGMHLCNTYFTGLMTTENGAEISFNARGYGFRGYDSEHPYLWKLTAALRFGTDNKQFHYLNNSLGIWEGTFNENNKEALYHAYLSALK